MRVYLLTLGLLSTLSVLAVVAQGWLIASAVSVAVDRGDPIPRTVLAGLVGVVLARALLVGAGPLIAARATASVKADLRCKLVEAHMRRAAGKEHTSSVVVVATRGVDALDPYFARYLPSLAAAVTVPVVVGTAVAAADWLSALIIALTLPLIPLFMVLVGWTTQTLTSRRWRSHLRLAHHFADLVAGLPTLQVFGRARAQAEGLRRSEARSQRETGRVLQVAFLSALVLELLASLSVAVVAVVVGLRLIGGDLSFFSALFVLLLAPEPFLALRQVGSHFHDSAVGMAAAEQAFALIDGDKSGKEPAGPSGPHQAARGRIEAHLPPATSAVPSLARHPIVLDGVMVRVDGQVRLPALSVSLEPGEVVALAGPSGSGKSTALAVLSGLVPATAGRVLVGSTDLRGIDPEAWRARIGWVGQQPGLVSGSVADNVALGCPDASLEQLRAALDRVGGADIPLEQPVHPGSEGLSAGQRRRVALARALLRVGTDATQGARGTLSGEAGGGWLLLLDEPTAGLDEAAEQAAITAVLDAGVSTLIVSHRPAVLTAAHRIHRLQTHVVEEEGEGRDLDRDLNRDLDHPFGRDAAAQAPLEAPSPR